MAEFTSTVVPELGLTQSITFASQISLQNYCGNSWKCALLYVASPLEGLSGTVYAEISVKLAEIVFYYCAKCHNSMNEVLF